MNYIMVILQSFIFVCLDQLCFKQRLHFSFTEPFIWELKSLSLFDNCEFIIFNRL